MNQDTKHRIESSPEKACPVTNKFISESVNKSELLDENINNGVTSQQGTLEDQHLKEHEKGAYINRITKNDSKKINKTVSNFSVQVKSDADGFKYIGHAVSIHFSSQQMVNPLCIYGIIKFWYPKFGYFFVHLFENDTIKYSNESFSSSSKEGLTLSLSPFANERGWVSPKDTHLTILSSQCVWSPISGTKPTRITSILEEKICFQCCKKILSSSNTSSDFKKCTICEKEFHSTCLRLLNQKSFTRNVSEEALIYDAKEHKEYVLHRMHQEKLTNEFTQRQITKQFDNRHSSLRKRGRQPLKREDGVIKIRKRLEKEQTYVGGQNGLKKYPHKITNKYKRSKYPDDTSSDSTQSSQLSCLSYEKEIFETSHSFHSNFNNIRNSIIHEKLSSETIYQENNFPLSLPNECNTKNSLTQTNWKCPDCLVCLYCKEKLSSVLPVHFNSKRCFWKSGKKSRGLNEVVPWVICYVCGLCAHGSCCLPEVPLLHPNARWKCDKCTVCFLCGYKDLQWVDYTAWDPCFLYCFRCYKALQKGHYCCVCRKPIDGALNQKKSVRQCQKCRFLCHTACDNFNDLLEKEIDIQTSQPYICYTCREGTLSQRCSRVIEAMILYDKKKYFSYPVPLSCLSYWRVVKHPMNFFEIKAKAYYDLYQDSKDFLMDLFVTFFNTKIAYMPNTSIYRHATRLEKRGKTMSFSILGLGKPTKEQLVELHIHVEKISSTLPSQPPILTDIQDCYDFEHLRFFTKDKLGIYHNVMLNKFYSKHFFSQENISAYVTPPYANNDTTSKSTTPYISSKRVDCSLDGTASVRLWWLEKKDSFLTDLKTTLPFDQPLDIATRHYTVNLLIKEDDIMVHNFNKAYSQWDKNLSYIDTSTHQFLKTLFETALAGFDIICTCCCISAYITNDLNLLNFFSNKYLTSCHQPFYCVHCSKCIFCDKSQCFLFTKEAPRVVFPSLIQRTPLVSSQLPCQNTQDPVILYHLEKAYQSLPSPFVFIESTYDDFSWFSRQKHSTQECCICNTMIHSVCTHLPASAKSSFLELPNRYQVINSINIYQNCYTPLQNKIIPKQPLTMEFVPSISNPLSVSKNRNILRENSDDHKKWTCATFFINIPLFLKYFQGFDNMLSNDFTIKLFFCLYGNWNIVQLFFALCKIQLSREFSSLQQDYWSQSILKLLTNPLIHNCDILQNINYFLPWMNFPKISQEESLIHDQNMYNFFISLQNTQNNPVRRLSFVNVCGFKIFLPYTLCVILKIVQDFKKCTFICGQCQHTLVHQIDNDTIKNSFPFIYISKRLQYLLFQSTLATSTEKYDQNRYVLSPHVSSPQPTLMCQLCGIIVNAWKYKDLCDISSCMLHIPYVCDECKVSLKIDLSYNMRTLTLLLQVFTLLFKDLRTRYLNTQTVKTILLKFFSVSTLFYENFQKLHNALNTFMDMPVFAPYRYRFLKDSQNFFYKKDDLNEYLVQVDYTLESSTEFPLFHLWLTNQAEYFSIHDYTCTNNILTLFGFAKLPFQKCTPFKMEKAQKFPLQSSRDPFSFSCNVTHTVHQRLLQWLSLTKPSLTVYQHASNHLCFEVSLLLGLYYRFIQWFKLYKFGHVTNDPTFNLYHDAQACFFEIPKAFSRYLHQIKKMCVTFSFSSLHKQVIERLQKLLHHTLTCFVQFNDLHSLYKSSKCLLCFQMNSNLLLGPLLSLNFYGNSQSPCVFVHKECVIWGCVSLLAKYPKIFNDKVDPFKHNRLLRQKYTLNWFSIPLSSSLTLPNFIVKYLYVDSSSSFCTICHLPHATVFCNNCLMHCYHLPCFMKSITSTSINPMLRFDLFTRRILQCSNCSNPCNLDARPTLLSNQYLGCFLMLLAYLFQSITFVETTHQDTLSFFSKKFIVTQDSSSEICSQNDSPWLSRRYKMILMLFEKNLTDLPLFNKKLTSSPQPVPSFFHSSICHIFSLGSSIHTFQKLKTSEDCTVLYGFHFIRKFWSVKQLLQECSTPTQAKAKSLLTLYSFEIRFNTQNNLPIYTITSTKTENTCNTTNVTYEHYYEGDTVDSVVSSFYDDLIPALNNWFHLNGQSSHIKKENLPSSLNLFGLTHPKVVAHCLHEKSIHDSFFVLNCLKQENGKFSQQTSVPINLKKLGTSFRSRLWLSINPIRKNHSFMLGDQHDYLIHYKDCSILTPEKWDNLREKYGLYVFQSHSEFPVSPTLTQDDVLELENLEHDLSTKSLSCSARIYSREKKISRMKATGNKIAILRTRQTSPTCLISDKKITRFVDYSVLSSIINQDNYIKTRVSPIHGLGLFAVSAIKKGQPIVEYTGHLIRNVIADKREIEYQNSGMKDSSCYMFRLNPYQVVDGTRAGNVSRFINHSCQPNCVCRIITDQDGRQHIIIFSATAIKSGEEITYDYKFNVEEKSRRLVCLCGAPGCLGRMN